MLVLWLKGEGGPVLNMQATGVTGVNPLVPLVRTYLHGLEHQSCETRVELFNLRVQVFFSSGPLFGDGFCFRSLAGKPRRSKRPI